MWGVSEEDIDTFRYSHKAADRVVLTTEAVVHKKYLLSSRSYKSHHCHIRDKVQDHNATPLSFVPAVVQV